ncbi:MAG TPA: AI-2E family transporter [Casimicrobiaceae bacterium]|jgi:predicted PurR-regulated permease PerM|nr:AI-2E family transporter [Casimicrobiaceae bacterium]
MKADSRARARAVVTRALQDERVQSETPLPPPRPSTVALTLIALILGLFAIRAGAAFFIPLLLSLFLNYALSPVVTRLASWGVPRVLGAALVVLAFSAAIAGAIYRVGSDAGDVLQEIPSAVQRLRIALTHAQQDHTGALEHVQRTASELQKLAEAASPAPPPKQAPSAGSGVDFSSMLLIGTSNIAIALGQLGSALFLAFFLLSAGDLFRRKFLRAVGGDFSRRRTTLRILDNVDRQNQRYFAIVLLVNVAVGLAIGAGFFAMGLERPTVWGIAAAVLHTIPYVGAAMLAGAAALVAYGQFGTLQMALLAATIPIVVAVILGIFVQTWLMGRAARMNTPAVFVSLLFWGMLWGGWGLLLAVPIMVAIKTLCDHVERLKPYGDILGP